MVSVSPSTLALEPSEVADPTNGLENSSTLRPLSPRRILTHFFVKLP